MTTLEIESPDVIRLIEQFLKENNLTRTLEVLQEESTVSLNTIDSLETFQQQILSGQWDVVLQTIKKLKLSTKASIDLYEQIVIELIELREIGAARSLLRQTDAMIRLKQMYPERYLHLENILGRNYYDPREAYGDSSSKEKRRSHVAQLLSKEVSVVAPCRLMTLLSQAIKFQQKEGLLPPAGTKIDLFKGKVKRVKESNKYNEDDDIGDEIPTTCVKDLKFNESSHPEVAKFSPDGQYFVTGSYDGFIEVWSYLGKLRKDLKYQQNDELMSHDHPVLSLTFTRDSEMLASGDVNGAVKIWKINTGQCLRKMMAAHTKGVTSISFTKDNSQIISTSFDGLIRLHGLKSGKMLKEYRGHQSFVTSAFISYDSIHLISSSADATVRVWNTKSTECVNIIKIGGDRTDSIHASTGVNQVIPHPTSNDKLIICNKSSTIHVTDMRGTILYTFVSGKKSEIYDCSFLNVACSPRGEWLYGVAEDGLLYCFSITTGKLERTLKASKNDKKIIGVHHHPDINLLATYDIGGAVQFWKP